MDLFETITVVLLLIGALIVLVYISWRYWWFFRNPHRHIPPDENIVSPADGKVVYVKRVRPNMPVISIKKKKDIYISDILRGGIKEPSLLIGVFMSPLSVHYNRVPVSGTVKFDRCPDAPF